MRKLYKNKKTDPVLYVLLGALAVTLLAAALLFTAYLRGTAEATALGGALTEKTAEAEALHASVSEQQGMLEEYERLLSEEQSTINSLEKQTAALRAEVERLTLEVEGLTGENKTEAELLAEARAQLAELTSLLEYYQKVVAVNQGKASEKLTALFDTLQNDTPDVVRIFLDETEPPDETEEPDGDAEETDDPEKEPEPPLKGTMSYYYMDLTTGFAIGYNETEIRYSASLIKAPYIYCILEEIVAFEEGKRAEGDGEITYLPGEEKYDLSREWVYDSATMFKEGSGEIKHMENGTVLTYRQLVEYALLHSDNIAFSELRKVFGMDSFYNKVGSLGIKGTAYGFMQLSAEDCGKFLVEIYRFFETESEYALLMKDAMIRSGHSVMIVAGLWGQTVAHKYGWDKDAYHDMAIVLAEKPYILVIMSDLESGGNEVNEYIQSIVRLTDEIHKM